MRLGCLILTCVVLASEAHSAPITGAACPPHVENRVEAIFLPNGISARAKAKLLAEVKASRAAQLKACLKAEGPAVKASGTPALKPK